MNNKTTFSRFTIIARAIIDAYKEHYDFPTQGESHMQDCIVSELEKLWPAMCKGLNCGCTDGRSHSPECDAQHAAVIAGGTFLSDAPAAPQVGESVLREASRWLHAAYDRPPQTPDCAAMLALVDAALAAQSAPRAGEDVRPTGTLVGPGGGWIINPDAAQAAPQAQPSDTAGHALASLVAYLREEADFNRSWTDGRRGDLVPGEEYAKRRLELAQRADDWADAVERLSRYGAAPQYHDSTLGPHVGNSSFESWFSDYDPAGKGDKQRARDAYAAGRKDTKRFAVPQAQPSDEEIDAIWKEGALRTDLEPSTRGVFRWAARALLLRYAAAPQIGDDETSIWPIVNVTVDAQGNITEAKCYAPGLPPGNHDVYPVRVPYMDEHTEAWHAVFNALLEVAPDVMGGHGNGIECAVRAIKHLAERSAPQAGEDQLPLVPSAYVDGAYIGYSKSDLQAYARAALAMRAGEDAQPVPAFYVCDADVARLADRRLAGKVVMLNKEAGPGMTAYYAIPQPVAQAVPAVPESARCKELTDAEIERGWHATFSTSNPYCPCNLKSFTKAVRWAVAALTTQGASHD